GFDEAFVSKLDAGGNFVWARSFTGPAAIFGSAIAVDFAGNVYTTGFFQQTADFDPGPGAFDLIAPSGSNNIFVSKLDTGGNFLWAKQVGGSGADGSGNGVAVDETGNVYTTGNFSGTADFDPGPGTFNLTSGVHDDSVSAK